ASTDERATACGQLSRRSGPPERDLGPAKASTPSPPSPTLEPLTMPQPPQEAAPFMFATQLTEVQKRLDAVMQGHKETLETIEHIIQHWLDRATEEGRLASELSIKLTSARSVPDATAAYRDWLDQRMRLFAEDSRQILSGCQKFAKSGSHFISNGHSG